MEERNYTVYIHTNKINNKAYIGQTGRPVDKRWGRNGINYLRKNKSDKDKHTHFAYAICKYGWDSFEHIIFAENLTKTEADKMEKGLIALYNTRDPRYGYNIKDGGSNGAHSEETKKILSLLHTGKTFSEEHINKLKVSNKSGLKEVREKISKSKTGFCHTEESKRHMSESHMGSKNYWYGKKLSDEHKKKMSESHKELYKNVKPPRTGKHHSEETKRQLSEINKGKIIPEDVRKKLRKPVYCVELNTIYSEIKEAQQYTGVSDGNISSCCRGKRQTAGGYHWLYVYDQYGKDGTIILGAISLKYVEEGII